MDHQRNQPRNRRPSPSPKHSPSGIWFSAWSWECSYIPARRSAYGATGNSFALPSNPFLAVIQAVSHMVWEAVFFCV